MAFLGRSWGLAKACFHVLRRDKEIIIFPLTAGAIILLVLLALIISIFISPMLFISFLISTMLLGSIFFAFLGVFFEAAVVGCATIRLQGGDPKVRDGLRIAAKSWWPLLQWALIGVIIGIILGLIRGMFQRPTLGRSRQVRLFSTQPQYELNYGSLAAPSRAIGFPAPEWGIGDIISGVLGMAWAIATFFVVPVIMYEKLSPLRAVKRSVEIIKGIWKETLILKFGFKALFLLLGTLGIPFILLGVMAGVSYSPEPITGEWMGMTYTTHIIVTNAPALITGFAIAIAYWVALACVSFAIKGILKAALYEYSKEGRVEPISPKAVEFNPLNNVIRLLQIEEGLG